MNSTGTSYVAYNKIHNITATDASNNDQSTGIALNTLVNTDIFYCYNNMIYDMQGINSIFTNGWSTDNATEQGITTYTDGFYYIWYNTIFFSYNNVLNGNTCKGIHVGQPINNGKITLENNLIVCQNTPTAGNTYNGDEFYRWGINNGHLAVDYNLLYAGDSTVSNNIVGCIPNTNYQKFGSPNPGPPEGWQPFMNLNRAGSEYHSKTEKGTPFVNTTSGTMVVDLIPGSATLALKNASPVTAPIAITDDIHGDLRSATTPTIGADEPCTANITNSSSQYCQWTVTNPATYTFSTSSGMAVYTWTSSAGATVLSGAGTNTITVKFTELEA